MGPGSGEQEDQNLGGVLKSVLVRMRDTITEKKLFAPGWVIFASNQHGSSHRRCMRRRGEVLTSVGEGAAGGGDAAADKALAAANAVSRVRGILESKEAPPEARDGGAPTGRAAAAAAVAEVGNRGGQPAAAAAVTMVGSRRPAAPAAGAGDVGGQAAEGAAAGVEEVTAGDGRKGPSLAGPRPAAAKDGQPRWPRWRPEVGELA